MDPYPRTWAEINLGALGRNLQHIRQLVGPQVDLCLVAKADAYGHGLTPVSREALRQGADSLAVATVAEGVALREAGVEAPIMILSPILPIEGDQAVFYRLEPTVENWASARALAKSAQRMERPVRVHLKVDTGLSRFGCRPADAARTAERIAGLAGAILAGVSTHFVDSRNDSELTHRQAGLFDQVVQAVRSLGLEPMFHCSNSAGMAKLPSARHQRVRIGMHAYGFDPEFGAEAVMALRSRVVASRAAAPGATVGYGATWKAARKSRILTVGAGYGDGYPRALSNRAEVLVGGVRCPVVGLVCMDLLMVDATEAPMAKVGDVVELLGPGVPVAEVAAWAGTNCHEIVTRIAPRVPRRYVWPR